MEDQDPETTAWAGHHMASEVSERIRDVIAAAEAAAGAIRHEAEQEAQSRRRVAEEDARRLVDDARRDAEALLAERIRRISTLSDSIIERGEALLGRIAHAEEVRRELETLVDALGESADRLAREAKAELDAEPAGDREVPPMGGAAAAANPAPVDAPVEDVEPETPARQRAPAEPEPEGSAAEPPGTESAEASAAGGQAAVAEAVETSVVDEQPTEAEASGESLDPPDARIEDAVVVDSGANGDDQLLGARLVALQMAVAGGNRGEVEAHLRQAFELSDPASILDDVFGAGTDASKRVVWPSVADG